MENLIHFILGSINAETIWNILGVVGIASIISAYTSSKSNHPNIVIRTIDQTFRDLVNIIAANIYKAKNADDDR